MDRNRFWNEFKVVVAHNWRLDAGLLGIVFFATVAIMVVIMSGMFSEVRPSLEARTENAFFLCSAVTMVAMAYCSAMVYGDLTDKSCQMRLMMNPSAVAEKFWTRILHTAVVVVLISEVAANLGVLLWGVFQDDSVRTYVYGQLVRYHHNSIVDEMYKSPLFYVMSLTGLLCNTAAYAVGASYYRRHPFLHTTLVLIAVFLVAMFCIGFAIGFTMSVLGKDRCMQYVPDAGTAVVVLLAFNTVLCAPLLYWAYRRFARLQYRNR